ncbi:hypothetical protein EDC96DRAFT_549007 [Choanephora cucurbitarum]|nr:hypothetical protein EDC96DRAFT_549007 [Choanephora cucurbitarum]
MTTCKTLKDMLDSAFKRVSGDRNVLPGVVYVGFQFSKTTLSTFFLDYVQGYTCRLRKTKPVVVVEFDNTKPTFIQAYKKAHVALLLLHSHFVVVRIRSITALAISGMSFGLFNLQSKSSQKSSQKSDHTYSAQAEYYHSD